MEAVPAAPATLAHEDLADALCAAIEAENLRLNNDAAFLSVSHHAYHAGLRDAYLKVLRTIGAEYAPPVADAAHLAMTQPTGPNRNTFDHRADDGRTRVISTRHTEILDMDDAANLAADIAKAVTA